MNKFYSTIMMLAMMVAALSFTACGDDDDDDDDVVFSILIKSQDGTYENYIDYPKSWYHIFYEVNENAGFKNNHFIITPMEERMYQMDIIFLNHKYEFSDFQPGFNKFGRNDVEISHATDFGYAGFDGYPISGSARVIKNNGKSVIIKFNRYKYKYETNFHIYEVTLDGELIFMNRQY